MKYAIILASIVLVCTADSPANEADNENNAQNHEPAPLVVADLDKQLDGQEVTIKFTVVDVGGIAQRHVLGQAPSFVITAEPHGLKTPKCLGRW